MPSRSRSRSNRFKRPYNNSRRTTARRYGVSVKKANSAASQIQAAVRRAISKNVETKSACISSSDYIQIGHNGFVGIEYQTLLATTQGITDPQSTNTLCRIGDQINLKSISIRMMLELNERYSDVSFRILVIKSAKGDTVDTNTVFCNLSGNKMLDRINKERYTILYEKWGKIKAPNTGAITVQSTGSGLFDGDADRTFSRATKLVKINLPGSLFGKDGLITYENGSSQVKFYDYSVCIWAYSNYTTSSALAYNVLAVNDYVKEMWYKDA